MQLIRSLLFVAIFYPVTAIWVLVGIGATPFGRRATQSVVLAWTDFHHWLTRHLIGIRIRVEGAIPPGTHILAVKHQSMFETVEMVRLSKLPVIVVKRELADLPLFGWLTRRYGIIPVDRSAGAKSLRALVAGGKEAASAGRPIIIFPEGTRVPVGQSPPLRAGFAGLYRAVRLPVVPVAVDSGRLWGRGIIKHRGTVTFKVGDIIPAGLKREEVEARVHAAINALELAS